MFIFDNIVRYRRARRGASLPSFPPGVLSFYYNVKYGVPTSGGIPVASGEVVEDIPGLLGSPNLHFAGGTNPFYWGAEASGTPLLQGIDTSWFATDSDLTASRIFVVAEIRWQEVVRGVAPSPLAFGRSERFPGLINFRGGGAAEVVATGVEGTNHFLRPEDFGGPAFTDYRIDGDPRSGLDVGAFDRCFRVFEFARDTGWPTARLVLGDDRALGLAGRQWNGGIVAAAGLTDLASASDALRLRKSLLAAAQGGTCMGFVGDSNTAGYGVTPGQSFRGKVHSALHASVACPTMSYPGANIPGIAALDHTEFDAILARSAHPILFILLGTNDLGSTPYLVDGGNPATTLTNLASYVTARRAAIGPKLKVILSTLPARGDVGVAAGWSAHKLTFDAAIRLNHDTTLGANAYIDPALDPELGDPYRAASFQDGVHLTIRSHDILQDYILEEFYHQMNL